MIRGGFLAVAIAFSSTFLVGCQVDSKQQILKTDATQAELRAVQTRVFDTSDRIMVIGSVIATLQDLGFVIDQADEKLGSVSATRLSGSVMRMTVTVRLLSEAQVTVRASGQYGLEAVSDAEPFQQFFNALAQAMFLTAHEVN